MTCAHEERKKDVQSHRQQLNRNCAAECVLSFTRKSKKTSFEQGCHNFGIQTHIHSSFPQSVGIDLTPHKNTMQVLHPITHGIKPNVLQQTEIKKENKLKKKTLSQTRSPPSHVTTSTGRAKAHRLNTLGGEHHLLDSHTVHPGQHHRGRNSQPIHPN